MMVSAGLGTLNHTPPSSEPGLTHWGDFGLSAVELGLGSTGIAVLGLSYGLRRNGVMIATLRAIASWYLVPYAVSGAALLALALAFVSDSRALSRFSRLAELVLAQPGNRLANLTTVGHETLLNSMGIFWLLLTGTRILLVAHAWRLGKRALAQRDFLPRPKAVRVDLI